MTRIPPQLRHPLEDDPALPEHIRKIRAERRLSLWLRRSYLRRHPVRRLLLWWVQWEFGQRERARAGESPDEVLAELEHGI